MQDSLDKLRRLGGEAQYDMSCACGPNEPRTRGKNDRWIYPAVLPDGRTEFLLKVLMNNACERHCTYCAQRAGRDFERLRFEPEELARLHMDLVAAGRVSGLFLSSAIPSNPVAAMDGMLDAVEILRRRHRFRGYVHLKVLPGAEYAQVERAVQLANRVSVNLEAPGPERLRRISPEKDLQADLLDRMGWITKLVAEKSGRAKSQTTQFVVGASEETDCEIVRAASACYGRFRLSRVYYSGFQPVPDTPLDGLPPTPFMREHRLYQTDFLLRKYGFAEEEIPFGPDGNLSLEQDPKTAWALAHPERFPIEVNRAPQGELLRIPGIGPVSAKRILSVRRTGAIRELTDLRKLGAIARRAAPFILLGGKRPEESGQLDLFR